MMKRILFLLLLLSFGTIALAQSEEEEANLKAAFIYNFTRYVDWDTTGVDNSFIIGVIGPSSVMGPLTDIARTNTVRNKRIVVRHFNTPDEITFCNVLFIAKNTSYSLQTILSKTGRGSLTISEETGFAEQGTAFNFIVVNDKLKFEANVKSINGAGLKASSQLLKLAIIVN